MITIRNQISFFTPNAAYGSMTRVLSLLLSQCSEVLDANPTSLPLPPDAPPEIPRIILKSSKGDQELNVRLDRVDCSFMRPPSEPITIEELTVFQANVQSWVSTLFEHLNIQANRIGVVTQRTISHTEGSPATFLARRFCRDEYLLQPFGNANKFEIHCLKNYQYQGLDINSWVRIQTLPTPEGNDLISIVNDLNNIPTGGSLSFEQMGEFIANSSQETLTILEHYGFREGEQ